MKKGLKITLVVIGVIVVLIIILAATGALKFSFGVRTTGGNDADSADLTNQLKTQTTTTDRQEYQTKPFSFTNADGIVVTGVSPRGWDALKEKPAGIDYALGALVADSDAVGSFRANAILNVNPIPIKSAPIATVEDIVKLYEETYTQLLARNFPDATFGEQFRTTVNGVPAYVITMQRSNEQGNSIYQKQYNYFINTVSHLEVTVSMINSAQALHSASLDELFSSIKIQAPAGPDQP